MKHLWGNYETRIVITPLLFIIVWGNYGTQLI